MQLIANSATLFILFTLKENKRIERISSDFRYIAFNHRNIDKKNKLVWIQVETI